VLPVALWGSQPARLATGNGALWGSGLATGGDLLPSCTGKADDRIAGTKKPAWRGLRVGCGVGSLWARAGLLWALALHGA